MFEIYLVFKYLLFSWLVVNMDPLQIINERIAERNGFYNVIFYNILSCWKCLTFWVLLIVFIIGVDFLPNSVFYSSFGAFIASLKIKK